jgi:uncharacterized glyoxalase superfamily protein PhnB
MAVANLATSIAFYIDCLEFKLGKRPSHDMAEIIAAEDDVMLLAGPQAGDVTQYLAERHIILKPGDDQLLHFPSEDLDTLRSKLLQRSLVNMKLIETRWGDRMIELQDPDGYRLQFYTHAQHSPEETLAWYMRGVDELGAALSGLADADLDLTREPGAWSIRHIVNHLADSETLFVWWMKLALSEPGRRYRQNWPTTNEATSSLGHEKRDITPSLALIRANRSHILQIAQHVPNAFECSTLDEGGHKTSFGDLISLVTSHALEHIDEIMQTRQVHGK